MRLVEAVSSVGFEVMPQSLCDMLRNLLRCTIDEFSFILFEFFYISLLTNDFTNLISGAHIHTGQFSHCKHDLLLIDYDSVSLFREPFHIGMWITYAFSIVLTLKE